MSGVSVPVRSRSRTTDWPNQLGTQVIIIRSHNVVVDDDDGHTATFLLLHLHLPLLLNVVLLPLPNQNQTESVGR